MSEENEIVCYNVFALAEKPTAQQVVTAAKAAVAIRFIKKAVNPDFDIINQHASDYFRTHPNVNQLLYEAYVKSGRVQLSSREWHEPLPDGVVVASCLKYRYQRPKHTVPAKECIGTKWTFDKEKERDLGKIRQKMLEEPKKLPEKERDLGKIRQKMLEEPKKLPAPKKRKTKKKR